MKIESFAVLGALTWLIIPQAAIAQVQGTEDADSAKAAVRFQRAVELYHEGSYEGALAEFGKAYQIRPSYLVLYNIAQTQYALHDYVNADQSLMQYVADGGSEIPAERRAEVDEMTAKLEERIAHLQISTNLTGAEIRVDDVSVGTSPLAGPVPVNAGTRKVSASRAGSPEAVHVLTVAGKENVKVELQIDMNVVASTKPAPSAVSPSASLVAKPRIQDAPSRTGLIVSLSTTAALAVGTGVFGYLALRAQKNLNSQVETYPNTKNSIENARTKSKNYGYATDALGAATLISSSVALYCVFSRGSDSPAPKSGKTNTTVVLAPTVGGMVLQGSF